MQAADCSRAVLRVSPLTSRYKTPGQAPRCSRVVEPEGGIPEALYSSAILYVRRATRIRQEQESGLWF